MLLKKVFIFIIFLNFNDIFIQSQSALAHGPVVVVLAAGVQVAVVGHEDGGGAAALGVDDVHVLRVDLDNLAESMGSVLKFSSNTTIGQWEKKHLELIFTVMQLSVVVLSGTNEYKTSQCNNLGYQANLLKNTRYKQGRRIMASSRKKI